MDNIEEIHIMKNLMRDVVLAGAVLASASLYSHADAGGMPNESACTTGNASFCSSEASVPEISSSIAPIALGLISALLVWRRERKRM